MPEVPASPPDLSPSRCSILQVKDSLFPSTFVTGEYRAIAYIGDEMSFGRELECEMSFERELECEMSFGRELECEMSFGKELECEMSFGRELECETCSTVPQIQW